MSEISKKAIDSFDDNIKENNIKNKQELTDEIVNFAVDFWVKFLTDDKGVSHIGKWDSKTAGTTTALKTMVGVAAKKASKEQIAKFKKILSRLIREKYNKVKEHDNNPYISLSTDYGPEGILAEAFHETDIDSNVLPWKTIIFVDQYGVQDRNDYILDKRDNERIELDKRLEIPSKILNEFSDEILKHKEGMSRVFVSSQKCPKCSSSIKRLEYRNIEKRTCAYILTCDCGYCNAKGYDIVKSHKDRYDKNLENEMEEKIGFCKNSKYKTLEH